MNPSRILPDLQCSLICEDIRQEANGNFILVGVLGLLRVPQVPITAFRLCVFNRWSAGVGQFTETVRLIGADQTTVMRASQTKFALKDAAHHSTNATVLSQIQFPAPGVYFIEVLVDDVMKIRYPVPLVVVPPPARPGSGAPKPGASASQPTPSEAAPPSEGHPPSPPEKPPAGDGPPSGA